MPLIDDEDNSLLCDNCSRPHGPVEGGDCDGCGGHYCGECFPPDAHDCEEEAED